MTDVSAGDVDEEEGSNWYELDGKKIPNRVTDRVKKASNKKFSKGIPEKMKAVYEVYRTWGVVGHSLMEDIYNKYIGEDGYVRETPEDREIEDPFNSGGEMPAQLEQYFQDLLLSFRKAQDLEKRV